MPAGLDVGTSFIISAKQNSSGIEYREIRDAFYRIKPTTSIAAKMIEKGLAGRKFFRDSDGCFVIIGQDAIEKAVERHDSASRPMVAGVLSPGEKDARRILKFLLSEVVGTPEVPGDKLVYSIPAQPVDVPVSQFDVGYHEDVLKKDLTELGFTPIAINEAEAVCFAELENDGYTGLAYSFGAGMANTCIMSNGEGLVRYATVRSGDWLDKMVAIATQEPDSVVQQEKEAGGFVIGQYSSNPILAAYSAYYERLITYTVQHLKNVVSHSAELRKFKDPLPIVIAGGTSKAAGFVDKFREEIIKQQLPIQVKEVRAASDPLYSVAKGCLICSLL